MVPHNTSYAIRIPTLHPNNRLYVSLFYIFCMLDVTHIAMYKSIVDRYINVCRLFLTLFPLLLI